MAQLWVDLRRELLFQTVNAFGYFLQTGRMPRRVPTAFFIGDNGKALAQRSCELSEYFLHRKSLKRGALSRKRPLVPAVVMKRILVVDDDVGLMRVTREALTSFLRCEVDTSPKPEYGFELALKKSYDLLIFDFSMPMIDGAMLFFLIGKAYENAQPPRSVPPLLLISGRGEEERAQELLHEVGVRGFIPKPFAINRLIEKVKECIPGIEPRA